MGYRKDLLSSRSVVKHGAFAIISPEGLVNNVLPFFEGVRASIIASPKLGASFVEYLMEFAPGGRNRQGFGGNGIETFVYVLDGKLEVVIGEEVFTLDPEGYVYCPPDLSMIMTNHSAAPCRVILYKQRYLPVEGIGTPWIVSGHTKELPVSFYDGMTEVTLIDLLPKDIEFDMNFHILSFLPGASHPFIETHVQEHGAYLTSGEGMYNLDNEWYSVKKDDFIWMGPFVQQATYAVGRAPLTYLYSKDCNRDPEI